MLARNPPHLQRLPQQPNNMNNQNYYRGGAVQTPANSQQRRTAASSSSIPASAPLPPRFFQLDSSTLQTGLEERIRDVLHSSVSPLVNVEWMEEFRALVEIAVSSACFGLGLVASSPRFAIGGNGSSSASSNNNNNNSLGYTVAYGDQIYNLRYVVSSTATSLLSHVFSLLSSSTSSSSSSSRTQLLSRLFVRFILLSILPVLSRMLQRRYLQREDEVPALHYVRQVEKVLRALDLLNHIAFLYSGHYRHVIDRLLGIRLASGDHDLVLSAHTYLIDRQHYWQTVFAAMSLFMPMLNLSGWAKYFVNIFKRVMYYFGTLAGRGNNNNAIEDSNNENEGSNTNQQTSSRPSSHRRTLSNVEIFECLICHTAPMAMPRRVRDCGHVCVCYYCSQTARPDACPECHGFVSGFTE